MLVRTGADVGQLAECGIVTDESLAVPEEPAGDGEEADADDGEAERDDRRLLRRARDQPGRCREQSDAATDRGGAQQRRRRAAAARPGARRRACRARRRERGSRRHLGALRSRRRGRRCGRARAGASRARRCARARAGCSEPTTWSSVAPSRFAVGSSSRSNGGVARGTRARARHAGARPPTTRRRLRRASSRGRRARGRPSPTSPRLRDRPFDRVGAGCVGAARGARCRRSSREEVRALRYPRHVARATRRGRGVARSTPPTRTEPCCGRRSRAAQPAASTSRSPLGPVTASTSPGSIDERDARRARAGSRPGIRHDEARRSRSPDVAGVGHVGARALVRERLLEHREDLVRRAETFRAGVVVGADQAQREVRLGREHEHEQRGTKTDVAVEQAQPDRDRHERDRQCSRRSSSTSDERNASRSVDIVVRRYSSVTSRIVRTCAFDRPKIFKVASPPTTSRKWPESSLQRAELPVGAPARCHADQRHEQRDERQRDEDDRGRDPVLTDDRRRGRRRGTMTASTSCGRSARPAAERPSAGERASPRRDESITRAPPMSPMSGRRVPVSCVRGRCPLLRPRRTPWPYIANSRAANPTPTLSDALAPVFARAGRGAHRTTPGAAADGLAARHRVADRARRVDARRERASQPRDVRHDVDGAAGRSAHGAHVRQEHDRQGRVPAHGGHRAALRDDAQPVVELARR